MKRKTPALILGMMISTVLLTGCAETPEDSLVKNERKRGSRKKFTKKQQRYLKVRQVQKEQRTQIKLQFGIL